MEETRPVLKSILYGEHSHVNPEKVMKALNPKIARTRPDSFDKSAWELLYHMWYWQDVVLRAHENDMSVKNANDQDSWPSDQQMEDDSSLTMLVNAFLRDLERLSSLAAKEDLLKKNDIWPDTPLIHNLMIEVAHNSYHLGQIVAILSSLGAWPP